LKDIESIKNSQDTPTNIKVFIKIYQNYIKSGSEHEVNISSGTKKDLQNKIEKSNQIESLDVWLLEESPKGTLERFENLFDF
jgi:hypothetical protein